MKKPSPSKAMLSGSLVFLKAPWLKSLLVEPTNAPAPISLFFGTPEEEKVVRELETRS